MRSLTDLQALCTENGIVPAPVHREECMDALREKLGTFDPSLQLDPMKAIDLKARIAWGETDVTAKFAGIADEYLNDKHVADVKLDGARMRLFLGGTANTMNSGRRSDRTYTYIERADNFPHIRDLVVPELAGTILDGEMMPPKDSILTSSGLQTVGTLNSIMAILTCEPAKAVAVQKREGNAVFVAFDVIAYKGESMANVSLSERRAMLEQIVKLLDAAWLNAQPAEQRVAALGMSLRPGTSVTVVAQMDATAENIQASLDAGFEGVIIKAKASLYEAGRRPRTWAKVKRMSTGDFVIFGSVPGKGRNEGKVGSMKVAYFTASESDRVTTDSGVQLVGLRYCADVAGITDAYRANLTGPDGKLDPKHVGRVIEVQAQGRTKNDRLRHPLWVRDRQDKAFGDCEPACSIDLFEVV